jgi:hypothetical protein
MLPFSGLSNPNSSFARVVYLSGRADNGYRFAGRDLQVEARENFAIGGGIAKRELMDGQMHRSFLIGQRGAACQVRFFRSAQCPRTFAMQTQHFEINQCVNQHPADREINWSEKLIKATSIPLVKLPSSTWRPQNQYDFTGA